MLVATFEWKATQSIVNFRCVLIVQHIQIGVPTPVADVMTVRLSPPNTVWHAVIKNMVCGQSNMSGCLNFQTNNNKTRVNLYSCNGLIMLIISSLSDTVKTVYGNAWFIVRHKNCYPRNVKTFAFTPLRIVKFQNNIIFYNFNFIPFT
jgi:hypothetical protein